jgi:hypothetical protein
MGVRFGLIAVAAVAMTGGVTGTVQAQEVSVQNWNFNPANMNANPVGNPTINPAGTYTVPAPAAGVTQNWRVVLDYGTLVDGTFTVFPNGQQPGNGLIQDLSITNANNNGSFNLGGQGKIGDTLNATLAKLPANTAARVRLQYQNPTNQVWANKGDYQYYQITGPS